MQLHICVLMLSERSLDLCEICMSVEIKNEDQEYLVIQPATIKPVLVKVRGMKQSFRMVATLSDEKWQKSIGDNTYFVYPIHSSRTFMSSKSIASSMYLLALRLMTHKYKEAFRLIDSCVCDATLTPQEQQMFEIVAKVWKIFKF